MSSELQQDNRLNDSDKVEIGEVENGNHAAGTDKETDPNEVTMSSFAHLDEKKILRKMDMRLIPVLTLLYLLSYLDREFEYPRTATKIPDSA
jgi:hypothetical protein